MRPPKLRIALAILLARTVATQNGQSERKTVSHAPVTTSNFSSHTVGRSHLEFVPKNAHHSQIVEKPASVTESSARLAHLLSHHTKWTKFALSRMAGSTTKLLRGHASKSASSASKSPQSTWE